MCYFMGLVYRRRCELKMASTKIQVPSNAVAKTYTWPETDGSNGQHLTPNGSGELSWATAASGC